MKPLTVEIITYAPTQFYHCQHCEVVWNAAEMPNVQKWHHETLETSIPPEMMQDYRHLADWVARAAKHYGGRVVFKIIDAISLEGVFKAVRYGVRKFPAFIIEGQARSIGQDFHQLEQLIDQRLTAQSV